MNDPSARGPAQDEQPRRSTIDPSVRSLVGSLVRALPLALLVGVIAAGVAVALSSRQSESYTSTSVLGFGNESYQQAISAGYNPVDIERQLSTTAFLITLPDVTRVAAGDLTPRQLREVESVNATAPSGVNVIRVQAKASSPGAAAAYANATVRAYLRNRAELNAKATRDTRRLLRSQARGVGDNPGARQALQTKLDSLDALQTLEDNSVQVLERAVPAAAESRQEVRNGAIAFGLGTVVALAVALLVPRRRRPDPEPPPET